MIKTIKTSSEYQIALKRMDALFDAPKGTLESDEADILGSVIEDYEKNNYPIEAPDSNSPN